MAFKVITREAGVSETVRERPTKASTQFTEGDALKLVNGQLTQLASQTDKALFIYKWMPPPRTIARMVTDNLSTAACEPAHCIPCDGSPVEFETNLDVNAIPQINGQIVVSGSTTTAVVPGGTGLGVPALIHDFEGGTLYFKERDTHVNITGTTVSSSGGAGNNYTFTFSPPLPSAAAAGETVVAVPFAVGMQPKFNATTPHQSLSIAVGDQTGGMCVVTKVDLKNYRVRVRFVPAPTLN